MDARTRTGPLVVIVGETASGKSAVGMELAKRFNGEIICADSRTVYRGLDIGTAKPTEAEQAQVRHHLVDIVDPDQAFTVSDFKRLAKEAINDIASRGRLPIMVGGTGLYIDAVLYDFQFRSPASSELRQELSALSVDELQERIRVAGLELPENAHNPRHLIRVLESGGELGTRKPLRKNTLVLGLRSDREALRQRIMVRVDDMVEAGLVEELQRLVDKYGWNIPALQGPGYKAFRGYLEGTLNLEEAKALFVQNDMQLAKKQRTWFRRNNSIHWVLNSGKSVDITTTFLNKNLK
ncbi:MAG TPA: tRNA (adenosine(37)-N6)-dimethylallyltransferase MiaA [Candidatus Limnocylindria bacterium]|nr:tRNA (adenosine(37)-N6)-dimethylallyltransferase MiaA [Candidatus Limnocylindria bacterium]